MNAVDVVLSATFLAAVLRVSTPYLLAALGGLLAETAGVPNVALEGSMLAGACAGALVSGYTGSVPAGVCAGLAAGAAVGILLAVLHLQLGADAIIAGVGLNLLVSGVTAFAVFALLHDKSGTQSLLSGKVATLPFGWLDAIPLIGAPLEAVIGAQNALTWFAFGCVPALAYVLGRTRPGVHLRAVGAAPDAARSVGIRVARVRHVAVILSGALAGLGGVFLSMGYVNYFIRDMTAGRGFIALAALFLGARRPVGTALAAIGFGTAEALAIQLGNLNVPSQLVSALPYAATLLALTANGLRLRRRVRQLASARA